LKVESEGKPKESKAQMVRNALEEKRNTQRLQQYRPRRPQDASFKRGPRERTEQKVIVNLFDAKPLNIFQSASNVDDPLETWSRLEKRELRLAVTHPPRNYFGMSIQSFLFVTHFNIQNILEKMMQWTDQGKVWKFPIDNEQGMDLEMATDFTEHVMLEMHLEGWCPTRGPIRHFMELVCVGLGKNNFLSAQEKKEHILWYKEYFESKSDVLGDLLTLGIADGATASEQKQIES
jgi:small subunit ribosomal protein S31